MLNNQKQLRLATFKVSWKGRTYIKGCKMSLGPFAIHRVLLSDFSLQLLLFLLLLKPLSLSAGNWGLLLSLPDVKTHRVPGRIDSSTLFHFSFSVLCCLDSHWEESKILASPHSSTQWGRGCPAAFQHFQAATSASFHYLWFLLITNVTLTLVG